MIPHSRDQEESTKVNGSQSRSTRVNEGQQDPGKRLIRDKEEKREREWEMLYNTPREYEVECDGSLIGYLIVRGGEGGGTIRLKGSG